MTIQFTDAYVIRPAPAATSCPKPFLTAGICAILLSYAILGGYDAVWLDGSWKLHRIETAKSKGVKWELYDLAAEPKRATTMKKELTAWLESVVRSLNGDDYAAGSPR